MLVSTSPITTAQAKASMSGASKRKFESWFLTAICLCGSQPGSGWLFRGRRGFLRPLFLSMAGTQKKKNASWHFVRFLVTELHSKEGEAPKRGLWVVNSTGPPSSPGRLFPRSMTGGGPVDTAVTSPCPLHNRFNPRAPVCPRTHMGGVT